ncbi:hypothetical protein E4U59_004120 [Claviceps monticola]|nr:hypothetical protein E4U59_004120 [Claviceps monticola]
MRFTLILGLSAAVSALPLDGSDESLLSDLAPSGLKLPLHKLGDWVEGEVEEGIKGIKDILGRSPLPETDKVVVNVAN